MAKRGGSPLTEIGFPFKGINRSTAHSDQKPGTTIDAQNVRPWDVRAQRQRGCQRPGFTDTFGVTPTGAVDRIQCLEQLTSTPVYAANQLPARTMLGIVVADGTVKKWEIGTTTFDAVTDGANALEDDVPVIFGTEHTQRIYFTDGTQTGAKYYDQPTNAVIAWTASTAGTLPGGGGNFPRLICTWRGRIVLANLYGDFHNWFMSAVGDPHDWDYGASPVVETMAVAGNNSEAGKLGDFITGLIPFSDDTLIFLGDHSIHQMTGDPMAGGRIDLITDAIGGAWGQAWCRDYEGNVYFVGSRGGVFKIARGSMTLERISQGIDHQFNILVNGPNWSGTIARLVWDQQQLGMYLFLTPNTSTTATINYYYDFRTKSWWPDVFADSLFNPLTVRVYDGDAPDDRSLVIGCQDGRVRTLDYSANTDDGDTITSYVVIGPIQSKGMEAILLRELQAVFAEDLDGSAADLTWEAWAGPTAERAMLKKKTIGVGFEDRAADMSGTWGPGRNMSTLLRMEGAAFFLKISNTTNDKTWALEKIVAVATQLGIVRQRTIVAR